MLKRILIIALAVTLVVTLSMPVTAFGAKSANAKKLDSIKTVAHIKKYEHLPTGGTKISSAQLAKLQKQIKFNIPGKGDTRYTYELNFSKRDGKYSASKYKHWHDYNKKTKFSKSYWEDLKFIIDSKPVNEKVRCSLSTEDKKYSHYWVWLKKAKTGDYYRNKKTKIDGGDYDYKEHYRDQNYRKYKDEKVLGETCLVWSNDTYSIDEKKVTNTTYQWMSRKTGILIKYAFKSSYTSYTYDPDKEDYVETVAPSIDYGVTFEEKNLSVKKDFYVAPKDVKWKKHLS